MDLIPGQESCHLDRLSYLVIHLIVEGSGYTAPRAEFACRTTSFTCGRVSACDNRKTRRDLNNEVYGIARLTDGCVRNRHTVIAGGSV